MTMAKRMTGSKIVPQCDGCCLPDFSEGYCTAFDDPAYQWRNGECWGRCESPREMVRRLEDIVAYAGPGANIATIRRELEDWEKMARLLKGSGIA